MTLYVAGSLAAVAGQDSVTSRLHHYPHGQHPAHPLGPPPSPRVRPRPVPGLSPWPRGSQCRAENWASELLWWLRLRAPRSHHARWGHDGLHWGRGRLWRLSRGLRGGSGQTWGGGLARLSASSSRQSGPQPGQPYSAIPLLWLQVWDNEIRLLFF